VETGNIGIIGLNEEREKLNAMKNYYRLEYKKLMDKEKKADSDLSSKKWKIRFGSFGARVGLLFSPNAKIRSISRIGSHIFSFCAQNVLKLKNKIEKNKIKKQKDKLTADFINAEGEFKQFDIINPTTGIEEIQEIDDKEINSGFHK